MEVAEIRTIVTRIDRELLGEGSGGSVARQASRINRLEKWRSWMLGAIAAIAAALGAAVTLGAAAIARMKG